jgi:hypothetical protein
MKEMMMKIETRVIVHSARKTSKTIYFGCQRTKILGRMDNSVRFLGINSKVEAATPDNAS